MVGYFPVYCLNQFGSLTKVVVIPFVLFYLKKHLIASVFVRFTVLSNENVCYSCFSSRSSL